MSFTTESKSGFPAPVGICAECVERMQFDVGARYALCYCKHHLTGGVYFPRTQQWKLTTPCDEATFMETMKGATRDAAAKHKGTLN